jgi:glycosyltransferase involved in cell wall biosynthesis
MKILVLQETDWINRGPHPQHHLLERLSINPLINVTVLDYDIDKLNRTNSIIQTKRRYSKINRTIKNSRIMIIRSAHIQAPYLRRLSSLIANFFQILKLMRKNRPDIIIGYSLSNGLIGLILSKLFKIPYVFHYIDILHELVPFPHIQFIAKSIASILFKFSNLIIVLTKIQRNYVINQGGSPEKIKILPNGIALENASINERKLKELKNKFSILDQTFVIFFMGWLYDFAGLQEIIDYYNMEVKKGKINLKFLILGDGGVYYDLLKHIKTINAEWVVLAGRVPYFEISEYIELSDLCLLSFKINDITREISPIKAVEYLAMKKPVLSTSLPGVISEIGYNNGIIYTKNQNELILKIEDLISQKENLRAIGLKGYNYVKEKYAWNIIINIFKQIMIDALKNFKN